MKIEPDVWSSLLCKAKEAARAGEVPVAAAIIHQHRIIALEHNLVEQQQNPLAHAEMLVMKQAMSQLGSKCLSECDLYVTLEPCTMCAGAIAHARIHRLYFGAYDPKGGAVEHGARLFHQPTCHHRLEIYGGIRESEFSELLKAFFSQKRR